MRFQGKELEPFVSRPRCIELIDYITRDILEKSGEVVFVCLADEVYPIHAFSVLTNYGPPRNNVSITADPKYERSVSMTFEIIEARYTELATRYHEFILFKKMVDGCM